MATKKKVVLSATEIAMQLADVRMRIARDKLLDTKLTSALKEAMESEQLREAGNYQLSTKTTLKVSDPDTAATWAAEHGCFKIDTSKAKEILRHTFTDPSKFGFAIVESDSIVPKGRKEETE